MSLKDTDSPVKSSIPGCRISSAGVSDFDMRHQINSNWVYELPFGRGRRFGSTSNKIVEAVLGGWGVSGIFHWTSGLPFSMGSGAGWSTNWELEGRRFRPAYPKGRCLQRCEWQSEHVQGPSTIGARQTPGADATSASPTRANRDNVTIFEDQAILSWTAAFSRAGKLPNGKT